MMGFLGRKWRFAAAFATKAAKNAPKGSAQGRPFSHKPGG
jgi:hypothetical protein